MEARRARRERRRWAATAGVVLVAVGVLAFDAYGSFTGTATTTHAVSSGTMVITLANSTMSIDSTGVGPDYTVERFLTLTTSGGVTMSNIKLTTDTTCGGCASSVLDTDPVDGLQLAVDSCDQAWTDNGAGNAHTCGGTLTHSVTSSPVVQANTTLNGLALDGTANYLRITLHLPIGADDSFRNKTSVIEFVFSGTQATGKYM